MNDATVLTIGSLAHHSGVKIETIRYYERIGLIAPAARTTAGQRRYGPRDVERLTFIRRARGLGFSLDDIAALSRLAEDAASACADVEAIARRHLDQVRERISALQAMERALSQTVETCGSGKPECPVLESLGRETLL